MEELDKKLGAILQNPQMMETIMKLAQSMEKPASQNDPPPKQEGPSMPPIDLGMVQKLSGLAGQSSIDQNQRTLLSALRPYLSQSRISKLERAMRAAKMAGMAGILTGKPMTGR